jgi:hypothetical protein
MSMKQKLAWSCSVGLLFLAAGGVVHAEGHLTVTLSQSSDKAKAESGIVHFEMENTGDEPVYVFGWKTPFASNDDRLPNTQFDVYDSSGKEMVYQGVNLNFGVRVTPKSFIVLLPHQSMGKDIDLAADYGMSESGEYSVTYKINLSTLPDKDDPDGTRAETIPANKQLKAASNTLKIWINPSLLSARKDLGLFSVKVQEEQYVCTAEQLEKLDAVKRLAVSMVNDAGDHLFASYQYTYDMYGYPTARDNTDERYVYWFGVYDTDDPYILPVNINKDNNWPDGIMKATYNRLNGRAFSYDCGCDPVKYPQDGLFVTHAWAESGNPYKMHICSSFWKQSISEDEESQVATMIHETTHFNDRDHVPALDREYSRVNVHNLAVNDRYYAVRNANNYIYYIFDKARQ